MDDAVTDNGYTNGRRFILTHTEEEGERSTSLHYLLPSGERKKVTIDSSEDSHMIRTAIGIGLATGKKVYGK